MNINILKKSGCVRAVRFKSTLGYSGVILCIPIQETTTQAFLAPNITGHTYFSPKQSGQALMLYGYSWLVLGVCWDLLV
jgi:hypothetical protein